MEREAQWGRRIEDVKEAVAAVKKSMEPGMTIGEQAELVARAERLLERAHALEVEYSEPFGELAE